MLISYLAKNKLNFDEIMQNFAKWYYHNEFTATGKVFDVGNTCAEAIINYTEDGLSYNECGLNNDFFNGNGSLMRIYPFVLFAQYNDLYYNDTAYVNLIKMASSLTHAHSRTIIGCGIYAYILSNLSLIIKFIKRIYKNRFIESKKYLRKRKRMSKL